ncbi:spore coat protein [Scatolibacter rhodanostii]|uniref:spore coat protein n=1 Tax=Scatolibacter rhodanostii TaxID=2014781 RepID=UPI000C08B016|nr:spore coat protein [Scatolibacter rhodanostii]
MDDRTLMESLLMTEKGICDLYMHGTIESGTQNVNQTFSQALNDSLCMQGDIYKKMSARGWYKTEQAEEQKIQMLKQKYANGMNASN